MAKREKVIVFLMLMTGVYGAYSFLFASPSRTGFEGQGEGSQKTKQFVTEVAKNIIKENLSETDSYIIARAEAEWRREPFLRSGLPVKDEEVGDSAEASSGEVDFTYSGYLEMMGKKLAVINGKEYREGEFLGRDEYVVRRISPARVVIGVPGKEKNIIIPFQETSLVSLKNTR